MAQEVVMNVSLNMQVALKADSDDKVQALTKNSGNSLANEMKQIRKARLHRQALQDPSLHGKLVATEASPVYNAKGEVIQALSANLGDV
jgi:DNA-binding IclR family transcriptional regulator